MKKFQQLVCFGLIVFGTSASAVIIAEDDFSYPDGDLGDIGNGSALDPGWAGDWVDLNGGIQLSGGVVTGGTVSRTGRTLSATQGADGTTVFIGFDLQIGADLYSAMEFRNGGFDDADMNFRLGQLDQGEAFADFPVTAGDVNVITLANDRSYRYVIEINYGVGDADIAKVYEDGTLVGTTATPVDLSFDRLSFAAFRDGVHGPFDNLVIATTFAEAVPEPSSLALLGLGSLLIARRRRS
ncbi:MAG: PEP-CTERM sorting domain-containing protein [Planctomycetota bacterium]